MPYLLLTLAALFWGGNYVVGHVLVQGVDPILMTEARWALYCSLLRLKDRRIPANGFVAVSSLLGALILLPIVIFWLMRHPAQDWAAWREPFFLSGLAYLVIFPSWLAYLFWNKGIATIGATRGEIYTHIIPLSGGVLSILFLHTQPHAWHLFSALFIMVGIVICSLEKRQAASIRLRD